MRKIMAVLLILMYNKNWWNKMRKIKFRAWDKIKKKMHSLDQTMIAYVSVEPPNPMLFDKQLNGDLVTPDCKFLFSRICNKHINEMKKNFLFMQYTGLKDKNGKEIYEGDIIKHVREISWPDDYYTGEPSVQNRIITRIGEVRISPNYGLYILGIKIEEFEDDEKENTKEKYRGSLTRHEEFSKVIGNIYENPELIK